MSEQSTQQPVLSGQGTSGLRASAEQIAAYITRVVGARACYLALMGSSNQRPRLLAAGGDANISPQHTSEIAALLRRTRGRTQPLRETLKSQPALALPLMNDGRQVGAALIVYDSESAIDDEHALATGTLAAFALDSAREIAALHVQAEEIEERARIREIQVSRNLIRGVIDGIPMGLALLDAEGIVLAVNRALSERFALDPAALVGMKYQSVIGSWEHSPAAQTFAGGQAQRARRTMTRADGSQTLLEVSSFPLFDADERLRQVVEVWEDITERVALQTQLVRAEKLAAIGQLAASIAHEVGNPLQAIQGFLALFLEQCPPDTPNRHFLELAEDEIDRIVQVVARLRDLYRPKADVIAPVNVNALIESVLLLTGKQLERARVKVFSELDSDLPLAPGVADQLKQVLLNLVLNAAEAMPQGGVLHIQTAKCAIKGGVDAITIAVTDTGMGIAHEQLPHIFDGLHTTKERGMGLGLYTSKAIIERHMGRITVQSTIGEGTTFTITLPTGTEEGTL